jgi:ferredoxin-thioredoxin reductase catalytic subunit
LKGGVTVKIRYNENEEVVKLVKEGLEKTGGYCPCRRERTEENICMCKEFKEQIKDPDFEGYCHCMLYYKEK